MSMSRPKISVVTPLYNCAVFVKESIESILNQTFQDFEFILLNDGSTDGTWEIVESFKDDRIVKLDFKENRRIPCRRNEAVAMARGEFIAIHDGDDISLPHRLRCELELLTKYEDIFCCGGHAEKIDESGKATGMMMYPPETDSEIVCKISSGTNPIIDPTTMFRVDDFRQLGGYSLEQAIYTVPDYDLWCRAVLAGKRFHNLQMAVIRYRINPNGMTQKHKKEMMNAHRTVQSRYLERRRTFKRGNS